ncbi:TlpA disulfide reductase family protein [Alistipes sp.]|uniref:peroxiredoxin family protein n=1 Tax=Alistipes sp. TaxID=1872444 RepID=UPI0025C59B25|nr:TlpA disulfide reductase family protein [Alistipes sp.]MCI7139670.1 TlpA family protein disulfide reductase [Alistipes sp.]
MAVRKSNKSLWVLLALIAIILAVILLLPGCGNRAAKVAGEVQAATLVEAGDVAPDFVVGMFDGSQVRLSDLRGKVVLLNFWATWCPPCRAEMARVGTDVIERFAGRDFVFLPLSRGEARSDVAAFREKNGYDFPMGLDSTETVYGLYASNYIPRNFLIDREGKVVATSVGYDAAEFDELIRTIEKTLENQ